jgi:hypothetical protein
MKNIFIYLLTLIIFISTSVASKADARTLSTLKNRSQELKDRNDPSAIRVRQDIEESKPILENKSLNSLPAAVFDGEDDYFNYNGESLANSEYTIFIVEQRTSDKNNNYFLGTVNSSTRHNEGLIIGYETNTSIVFGQGSNKELIAIEPYEPSNQKAILHTFVQDQSNGKKYYRNGAKVFESGNNINSLRANDSATIGRNDDDYFEGKLSEIIIYNRSLRRHELKDISNYLINKWNIEEIQEGKNCHPKSPGYVNILGGKWSDDGSSDNGNYIYITCDIGVPIGTVGPLTCKNGIYSGVTTGSCKEITCDPNSDGYKLIHGTWSAPIATSSNSVSANCTIKGGSKPTDLVCNSNFGSGKWSGGDGDCPTVYCPQLPGGETPICTGWGCYGKTEAPRGANGYKCKARTMKSIGCDTPGGFPINACRWNGTWLSQKFQKCIDVRQEAECIF